MLAQLSIQGLAIIESLNIEFSSGFNVITGETGAGKSILIKALGLLLGGKASPDAVRKGFEQANVSGRFLIEQEHPACKLLASWGVPCEEEGSSFSVLIRRQVTAKGRSSAWINDVPLATHSLKELAGTLIDVFGQHDNHRLLDTAFHTHYLDQFLDDKSIAGRVEAAWQAAAATLADVKKFVEDVRVQGRDMDYLAFRLTELAEFIPEADDFERCRTVHERAKSSMVISSALQKATRALDDDSGDSLARRLREVSRALAQPRVEELTVLSERASAIAEELDDLSFGLGRVGSLVDLSEEDIDRAESRIAGYQALFRKHNVLTVEELLEAWTQLSTQVSALDNASAHVMRLLTRFLDEINQLKNLASKLTSGREKAAHVIAERVERELGDLAMPGAKFQVELEPVIKSAASVDVALFGDEAKKSWDLSAAAWASLSESGVEKAQFYLSANAGEPSLPLAKVASGGEVSRIMLALKKALVVGAETCVLVFDEIDTGISGRIADTVGQKIAELADFCQIVCISHLPQVAAYADVHYVVEKKRKGDRTESNIRPLSQDEHFEEVARLLSGDKLTASSISHAKSLVAEARSKMSNPKAASKNLNLKTDKKSASKIAPTAKGTAKSPSKTREREMN